MKSVRRTIPIAILLLAITAIASQRSGGSPPASGRQATAPAAGTAATQPAGTPAIQQTSTTGTNVAGAQPIASSEPGKYVGVASCANSGCHGSTTPLKEQRVLQNEYYTWLNSDRHAQAYNVLFSERSARVARNMKLKGKAYQEKVCLDCHSTNVPVSMQVGHIDPEDGVQCEACHGPAGGWRAEHTMAGWTHEQSVQKGMIDLRSIHVRGSLCLSCHLGDKSREVDHELIASGHPILAFELDNYSETMPAHWNMNPTHGAPAWATGQAEAFRDSLDNLARHARGDKWPEFSDMSCYNCHHSLKNSGWRQERGYQYRAGLPAWSPQHWAVLRLIVRNASPSAMSALDDQVQQVAAKVARMNDPAGAAAAADSARKTMEGVLPQIERIDWTESRIRALMSALANDQDFIVHSDVHSAEQTALALQSLSSALTRRNPKLLRSPMTKAIDDLFTELQNRDDYEPNRFASKLAAVRSAI